MQKFCQTDMATKKMHRICQKDYLILKAVLNNVA